MPAAMMSRSDGKSAPAFRSNPSSNRQPGTASSIRRTAPPGQFRGDKPTDRKPAPTSGEKPEQKIFYQRFFKSVGTRTYAAQVKEAGNGNHFILLTEGNRDKYTGEVRKTKLIVFSEDFDAFFKLMNETSQFVKQNPVSPEVAKKQQRFWQKVHSKKSGA